MSTLHHFTGEPSAAELAAIEAEWPAIQADIDALADPDLIDALVDEIYALERLAMTELNRRRQRRTTSRITRQVEAATRPAIRKAVA
ncbi:DUF6284 family protein [Actinoplanes subtropicus]|uniref:DUF6284 family protein n=1 Tax=Actinoplanes subtropicus TaxID=543632 RepID=UPI0004C4598A|nr:DUF6284 family protein [Actinoplanes subtropicus]